MGNDNMSENNKVIFLDVDATLYSKEQRLVPESAITAIHAAQKNGHKVLINTGRPLVYFEKEILDRLNGFVKKTISTEHLKGKNVLISVIIMLTFIHIMDL